MQPTPNGGYRLGQSGFGQGEPGERCRTMVGPFRFPLCLSMKYCELLNVDRPDLPDGLKITPLLYKTQQERTQIMLQLSKYRTTLTAICKYADSRTGSGDNDILAQQVMREDVVDKVLKRICLPFIRSATQQSWSASSSISAMFLLKLFY
jgi:hypothetical protein